MVLHRNTVTIAFILVLFFASFAIAALDVSSSLNVEPQSSATGAYTIHKIYWNARTPINERGHIVISYKPEFDLDQLLMATSYDPDTMDGLDQSRCSRSPRVSSAPQAVKRCNGGGGSFQGQRSLQVKRPPDTPCIRE